MRVEARLIAITNLAAGKSVVVVRCGYGNGYPETAVTGTPVSIGGIRTRVIGKVAMNVIFIDLESVPKAKVGDPVTLWGDDIVRIEEVAHHSGLCAAALACGMALNQNSLVVPSAPARP